ncbi:uncharacterized protein LOC132713300 [Ruditapes philippinarum]|uniref:uncharacterized protein LOC132713300 n=1 Tax=Ruditapes philippinarum TaxID=129788 RepID=UPI00295A71C7|nr:uncharacterized protein LOC132713300 [Ruditapes philippinarum]
MKMCTFLAASEAEELPTAHDDENEVTYQKNRIRYSIHDTEFEPNVDQDFQTGGSETHHRIPHIIHFIFISSIESKNDLPEMFKANVNSFFHFNPSWTYYFWTNISARQLIATKHPSLLETWDNYPLVINKADALRYVLLYEFGGVYADLDMKCLRPLDRATIKYSCILTPEPFVHSAIIYKMPYLLSTAFMMCRPKHPFMKVAILSLSKFATRPSPSGKAGPTFLTFMFKRYNKLTHRDEHRVKTQFESNSPYFYKGSLREDHINAVYVANTKYFMNNFDKRVDFDSMCFGANIQIVQRGCILWLQRKSIKTKNVYSYTDHNWAHVYSFRNSTRMVRIDSVITTSKLKL